MQKRLLAATVLSMGLVLPISACSSDSSRLGIACSEVGNQEYVAVDLYDVLNPEGGDYYAEVRVDAVDASNTIGFAGNDDYPLQGSVLADLTSDPIRVNVIVRSTNGPDGDPATAVEVFRASGEVIPELYQPNGAQCDGENYRAAARATKSGQLVIVPADDLFYPAEGPS